MKSPTRILASLLACLLIVGLVACAKVTQENYDKIKDGMTAKEVEAILGKPVEGEGGGVALGGMSAGTKVWKDGNKKISITFMNDKVTLKAKDGF